MPKYWVKNYFAHGRFPEVGQKQKTEEKEERLNDGDNNGQATHGARKHAWRTQAAWAKSGNLLNLTTVNIQPAANQFASYDCYHCVITCRYGQDGVSFMTISSSWNIALCSSHR